MMDGEKIARVVGSKGFAVAAASALSLAGGFVLGGLVVNKKLTAEFQERMEREIEETKEHYSARFTEISPHLVEEEHEEDTPLPIEDPRPDAEVSPLKYHTPVVAERPAKTEAELIVTETTTVAKNIFLNNELIDPNAFEFDLERELEFRNPELPYVISFEEFSENVGGFEQAELTYYQADGILVRADDSIVFEVDMTVGEQNLLRFGHGSQDDNIVYIRNEITDIDFEVKRSMGSYQDEVIGLEHSDEESFERRPRRHRSADE